MDFEFLIADGEPIRTGCVFCGQHMDDEGINGMHEQCYIEYNLSIVDEMHAGVAE